MIKGTDIYKFSDKRKLILYKSNAWKESYLTFVMHLLDKSISQENCKKLTSSESSTCWIINANDYPLFIKFFHNRHITDTFPFRKSRSERARDGSEILLKEGFNAPNIIAQGKVVKKSLIRDNFIVTELLDDALNLYDFLFTFPKSHKTKDTLMQKRTSISVIGQCIGKLHKSGIIHGDLRPGNIFIRKHNDNMKIIFIDNERNRCFPNGIPERLRVKNLVQLNMIVIPQLTFTDRIRFFKSYLQENPDLTTSEKSRIRKIFIETRRRLQNKIPGIWER